MQIADFMAGKPVQLSDLFGPWKCRGFRDTDENASEKITKRLGFVRLHFGKFLKKNPLPNAATCKFKRGDVNGKGEGEWMLVLDASDAPIALFSASGEGFVQRSLQGASARASAPAPARKRKIDDGAPVPHETRTPKEIQAAIPLELRTTWVNYDLLDKMNERAYKESCDYWDKHNGQPEPQREYEDEVLPVGLE